MNFFSKSGLGAASFVLVSASALAQITTGTLSGVVRDPSGAAVANTPVTAVNTDTNVSYSGKTNASGEYRIGFLPAGTYNVKITAPGFAPANLDGLLIEPNQNRTGDLALSVNATSTVEVTSEAAVSIDTTTSQIGSTFLAKETQDLPTASIGLGVLNLSLLAPGVSSSGGIGAGTGPSIGGQRPRNNNFEIEGIDNNSKSVTGPLLYVPNDAVGEFSLLQNVYSAQYGHSTGGQFNSLLQSGTNTVHGRVYEYFQNRNLNAVGNLQAISNRGNLRSATNPTGVTANFQPRFDFNRYGGQLGGPIIKDKLFVFSNFERQTQGQSTAGSSYCAPTQAGITALSGITFASTSNFAVFKQYTPVATQQAPAGGDAGCPGSTITVTSASGATTPIAVGDFSVSPPVYFNSTYSTTSGDYIISSSDSLHVRDVYNRADQLDTNSTLQSFFGQSANRYHLASVNETHIFTANLTNDFRLGYNRYFNLTPASAAPFPGLAQFPNLVFDQLNFFDLGPDPNAPQGTIQNLYQAIDSLTWTKGKHTLVVGGEARKYISPQVFVQRARGDYEYSTLSAYLNDLSPDVFGQRNALGAIGTPTYYGDQTAFYAYANDDWRVTPTLTLNLGLRYEFTSIPASEKLQALNSAASVPGLITFGKPSPQTKNFAPRIGFNYAPDANTVIRGGFGINYDVLYDNIGTTEAPPQFQSTQNVNTAAAQTPNFLGSGGLPGTFTFTTVAQQRAATTAFVPSQILPYSEQYTLGVEKVFLKNYTAEVRYVGSRGIHLDVQDQINRQSPVTAANQLYTAVGGGTSVPTNGSTQASLRALSSIVPAFAAAGLTNTITADQPYGGSNYNSLQSQLTRRFLNGLLVNVAYTYSKSMDNSTADFNTTALNPRRPQDSQNVGADYTVSALDRRHRFTATGIYDIPFFAHSNWYLKNLVGNLEIAPVYTFQSPQLATPQSIVDSNLNNDAAPDRTFINPNGVRGTGSGVVPLVNASIACPAGSPYGGVRNGNGGIAMSCSANTVGYTQGSIVGATSTAAAFFRPSNAYYVQGGLGTLPNAPRNTLATGRTNDFDVTATKRFNVLSERAKVEVGVQAFNVLNHPQFLPGSINQVNSVGSTGTSRNFVNVTTPSTFNVKSAVFDSNSRSLQLSGKVTF